MSAAANEPHVLRDYALLADGRRGALIGPRGDITWLCAPSWDSEAVFARLIGGQGLFAITPRDQFVSGGHYEDDTLIWRSRWVRTDGITECREALAYPGRPHRVVLLRRLLAVSGDTCATVTLAPAAGFGRYGMADLLRDDRGAWHGRCGSLNVTVHGIAHAGISRDAAGIVTLHADLKVPEGGHHDVILELSDLPFSRSQPDADRLWSETEKSWKAALPNLDTTVIDRDARHSYAVLRAMTTPGSGTVAAATTSLPERADRRRNYDYRYVWIRDQCYIGQSLAVGDAHPLLDDSLSFVTARLLEDGPDLKPAYRVDGTAVPGEHSLPLSGYPGGSDVVGNDAHDQFQLDGFGEALLLFAAAGRHDLLDAERYRAAAAAASAIAKRWQRPDAGVWELDNRRWTHSRLICVAGLRAIAAHSPAGDGVEYQALADTILAGTSNCVHPSGRWQRAPDDARIDAALLTAAIRGAVPADDPRSVATLRAVVDELEQDGFIYRFRHDDRPLADAEGAFLLCGFWAALACAQQGDLISATRYFERSRAACGPPRLFGEEYDVAQSQLRGNIPQAFVHGLLIESSLRLMQADQTHLLLP